MNPTTETGIVHHRRPPWRYIKNGRRNVVESVRGQQIVADFGQGEEALEAARKAVLAVNTLPEVIEVLEMTLAWFDDHPSITIMLERKGVKDTELVIKELRYVLAKVRR